MAVASKERKKEEKRYTNKIIIIIRLTSKKRNPNLKDATRLSTFANTYLPKHLAFLLHF